MTTKVVKRFIGEGGAGLDDSNGSDNLYDVVHAMADQLNAMTVQFNQFLADYNHSPSATHPTTATSVTSQVSVE